MEGFGWLAGVDYCPHSADASTAHFACVLGMPWASTLDFWDPNHVLPLTQGQCETALSKWLAPWVEAPVSWILMAKDRGDPMAQWQFLNASVVKVVEDLDPDPVTRRTLVTQCKRRLDAYVSGHPSAMGSLPAGEDATVLTYPIASPGLAHLPPQLSHQVLGTSVVISVRRSDIPANATILALPSFMINGASVGPALVEPRQVDPKTFEASYGGPDAQVGAYHVKFSGVVVNGIEAPAYKHDPQAKPVPHGFLHVDSRAPNRQAYATLTRMFSPLRLWLSALVTEKGGGLKMGDFCTTFVRLLGGGEDELDDALNAVGSIYEFILPNDTYLSLFQVTQYVQRRQRAKDMLVAFDRVLTNPAAIEALLERFATNLDRVGLKEASAIARRIATHVPSTEVLTLSILADGLGLYDTMVAQTQSGRSACAAWFAAVLPEVALANANDVQAATTALIEAARVAGSDTTGRAGPVLEDDVLRILNGQIDHAPAFWGIVHDRASIKLGLQDGKAFFVPPMASRVQANAALESALGREYDSAQDFVVQSVQESLPMADDPPLQLRFTPAANTSEESIRGCLLALRVGLLRAGGPEWKAQRWITNFHAEPATGIGTYGPVLSTKSGSPAVFCDTQGSTKSDGLTEQTSVYSGQGLHAAQEAETQQSSTLPEIYRGVQTPDVLVLLAFGACYGGICATVDNAGVIVEESLRDTGLLGNPCALTDALFDASDGVPAPNPFVYLSRQPPGAPVFVGWRDWDVAADTLQFHRHEGDTSDYRVAVLYSGTGYESSCTMQDIRIAAPSVGPSFMERWLATDALADAGDDFRWSAVKSLSVDAVKALRQKASVQEAPRKDVPSETETASQRTQLGLTHPAVAKLEVRISWYAGNEVVPGVSAPIVVDLRHLDGTDWIRDEHVLLKVKQAAGTSPAGRVFQWNVATGHIDVSVPKGLQARIEAVALIPRVLVEGTHCRLMREALIDDVHPETRPYEWRAADQMFVSRVPEVLWLDSLPEVPTRDDLFDFTPSDFSLHTPQALSDSPEVRVILAANAIPAAWIAGIQMEQKRWKWSGLPVTFPRRGDLQSWLPLYAGTTDSMPALPDARFTTKWAGTAWQLERLVMKPVPLSAQRPSSHMGVIIRAVARYEKLLTEDVLLRAKSVYIYDHLHGVPSEAGVRLPPPVWEDAIPLPQTLSAPDNVPVQRSRGNLLVLSDPVYDTADTGRFGGIAERIELDVVSTWQSDPAAIPIVEAGPNPIFHPAPGAAERQPEFTLDSPFGLMYDEGVGGQPAQTGLVIRPSNTQGRWVLAKCRLRRLVLPELVLGSELSTTASALLGLREVEDGWIPEDFALFSSQAIAEVDLAGYRVKFPVFPGTFERIYLVTWHRDRWAQAEPSWRPLVHLYSADAKAANWSIKARATTYTAQDFTAVGRGAGSIEMSHGGTAVTRRVDVSDFTESRWLTFIGGFGQEVPAAPNDIQVARRDDGNYVVRASSAAAPFPKLGSSEMLSPTLLLLFAPRLDVMRGRVETEGGELVGVYAASVVNSGAREVLFDVGILTCPPELGECKAVVIQMQKHNVASSTPEYTIGANRWPALVKGLFPPESDNKEATLRLLPEYLGPVRVR